MSKNISILSQFIELDSLKIVSFDIFDTLIYRPAINPKNIFYFLDRYYQETSGRITENISQLRINCENELIRKKGVENVTIDLIYKKLGDKTGLDGKVIAGLKEKEISLEVDLAGLNREIFDVLENVKKIGKKVVLTSDMYLTSRNIALILNKFHIEYDALYVSADLKKRKDNGELYDEMIYREKVQPYEILHIGDNETSDYIIPLKKGIMSFHYIPYCLKVKRNFFCEFKPDTQGITSVFLGYLFNEENNLASKERMKYTTLYDFGYYSLGPFLLAIMLNLLFSGEIQGAYDTLFFSSRDGYLPFKVYEMLRKAAGSGIPGKYIYCGRRALNIAHYKGNALDYMTGIYNNIRQLNTIYTTEELFNSLNLERYYVKTDNFDNNPETINNCISDYKALSLDLDKKKDNAIKYFNQLFGGTGKGVVFDCGYSGSISDFIYHLLNKRIDKIYMWEMEQNKTLDRVNKTKTYLFFENYQEIRPFELLFEEIFSPLETACTGYENNNGVMSPVFDTNEIFSEKMKCDLTEIHNGVFDYIIKFCSYFSGLIPYFGIVDYQSVFACTMGHLFNERDESLSLMRNIVFYDKYHDGNMANSLSNKLIIKNRRNSFKGNVLLNPDFLYTYENSSLPDNLNLKLGLHIHLFYLDQYIEFLERLKDFPHPFDLYITIPDKNYEKLLYIYFTSKIIPNLKKLIVILAANRGRDIAPWLIEMRNIHTEYDIFGHFHTKKNSDIGFGDEWRNYLLDNLLKKNVVIDILNLFVNKKNLGLVYPPMYKDVYGVITSAGDPPFQELDTVNKYLSKIGLPEINNCNEIHFSVGTMFWYRPHALKRLFHDGLSYNDFPQEPVGINGTLAHAIERLPSYIAKNAGYDTKLHIEPEILSKVFYNQYQKREASPISSSFPSFKRLFFKKLYFMLLGFIPGKRLRKKIDRLIRGELYPVIREYKTSILSDKIYKYKEISVSKLKGLKKIELDHWLGFKSESLIWDDKYIRTTDAWVIDYISGKNYYHVYIKVNNKLYKTDDHLPSPDVAEHFENVHYVKVRFSFLFPINKMNFGENTFSVLVILNDKKTYYETDIIKILKNPDNRIKIGRF
jgi:predicted HAD superfamily hydrolase